MSSTPEQIDPTEFLRAAVERSQDRFEREKALLSFGEFLEVVATDAAHQVRNAATYIRDAFLYFGTRTVERPHGSFRRFKLFDCEFDDGRAPLVAQEEVQEAVFGLLSDFVQEGRTSKLILLHGPNGSAKSSFISCVVRALEHYSQQPEGALYTFNWVFPSKKAARGTIGFGGHTVVDELHSFAGLTDDDVDARVPNEMRDHPLLLLPRGERIQFLDSVLGDTSALSEVISRGELGAKSRAIYDALLRAYHGDLGEVLKHVQVERFYISHRYRHGAVTVDPQMRVDAGVRQLTSDRSLSSLPPSLQNLSLFEGVGDLVDANRGLIEYNDLLKRPVEAFKYLLSTCENGTVSLETMMLHIDTVFIGSSNAVHLAAFQEMPDFASFKGRIELVQVPYLLDYTRERRIYAEQSETRQLRCDVAPHTDMAAGLWAVLTRLEAPLGERYPQSIRKTVESLTPLQKAELYAHGTLPQDLPRDAANELRKIIGDLYRERQATPHYEGRYGASPRELKAAMLGAARRPDFRCLSPLSLLEELRSLCKQVTVFEFLRLEPKGDYHRAAKLIDVVEKWYLDRVEDELHRAMGLVDTVRTSELFTRYMDHVTHFVRREKRLNPLTGQYEDPDEALMLDVESRMGVAAANTKDARAGIMHRIAAWRMDHPDATLDLTEIFSDRISVLTDSFYEEKRAAADQIKRNLLRYLVEDSPELDPEALRLVQRTLNSLETDFGYTRDCTLDVIGFVLKRNYASGQKQSGKKR